MVGFIFRAVITALGLWIATSWVHGIHINGPVTLLLAGALLGIVNAVIRPIAVILTLPFTILTLGLFLLVVNAGMLSLVALFLPGFRIDGFWPALWSALIVSVTGWIGSALIGPRAKVEVYRRNG
jgi:putative membrane protein